MAEISKVKIDALPHRLTKFNKTWYVYTYIYKAYPHKFFARGNHCGAMAL